MDEVAIYLTNDPDVMLKDKQRMQCTLDHSLLRHWLAFVGVSQEHMRVY